MSTIQVASIRSFERLNTSLSKPFSRTSNQFSVQRTRVSIPKRKPSFSHRPLATCSAFTTETWTRTLTGQRFQTFRDVTVCNSTNDTENLSSSEPQTFKFPDGSTYCGEIGNGRMNGRGKWTSPQGESYEGTFVNDTFEGRGCYTEASGNKFVGMFKGGAYEGPGTYTYIDGRAEVGTYSAGADSGLGARWSADGAQAWRLQSGQVVGEISLETAKEIAESLGLDVPQSIFALDKKGRERLQIALKEVDNKENSDNGSIKKYISCSSMDGASQGWLIAHSETQVVSSEECEAVIAECEARAKKLGGWTTERHENYPTTDVPLQKVEEQERCEVKVSRWFV